MRVLLIFFLLNSLHLYSDSQEEKYECGDDEGFVNETLTYKKITSQGAVGICSSHSLAQTYTALSKNHHSKELDVSPLFIALNSKVKGSDSKFLNNLFNKKKYSYSRLSGGNYRSYFKDFKKIAPCSPRSVEKFLYKLTKTKSNGRALTKAIAFLKFYKKNKKRISKEEIKKLDLDYSSASIFIDYLKKYGFARKRMQLRKSYLGTIYNFFLHQCRKNEENKENLFKDYTIKYFDVEFLTKDGVLKKLDESFTKEKRNPIGLSYKIKRLYKKTGKAGNHSSIIYGKICRNHKLLYLIRNSWGGCTLEETLISQKKCDQYDGDFLLTTDELKKTWTNDYGGIYVLKKK